MYTSVSGKLKQPGDTVTKVEKGVFRVKTQKLKGEKRLKKAQRAKKTQKAKKSPKCPKKMSRGLKKD